MSRRGLAIVVVVVAALGCNSSIVPSEATPSPGVTNATSCAPIDLRTPLGTRIDLTGTWAGPVSLRYVRQFGSCVWWEELSVEPGQEPGAAYRRLFFGVLQPDFIVAGQFGEIYSFQQFDPTGESRHTLYGGETWRIEIESSDGAEIITLVGPSIETDQLTGEFDTWVFTRISYATEALSATPSPD